MNIHHSMTILTKKYSIRRLGSVSVCTEPLQKKVLRLHHSVSILIFHTSSCSISWLSINHHEWRLLGFPRRAFLLIFDDAFVWTLSDCVRSIPAIRTSPRLSRQLFLLETICGLFTCFSFMQMMAHHFQALAQLLVQFSPWQSVKPLGHHLHRRKMIQRSVSF